MKRVPSIFVAVVALAATSATVAFASGTTQPATSVSFSSATLNAKVQAGDKVHFEYGIKSLNLRTPQQVAPSTTYSRPVSGLAPGKVYKFRVVTEDNVGAQKAFTTASAPKVSTKGSSGVTFSGAKLSGSVDPNGGPTSYRFEFGVTKALGSATPEASAGTGTKAVSVSFQLGGLEPQTRYYFRLTATNGAGTARGAIKTFATPKTPIKLSAFTLFANPSRIAFGSGATVTGKYSGTNVGGVTIVLEGQPFPYNTPFKQLSTAKTAPDGSYTLGVPPLLISTKVRVSTTRTTPSVVSETSILLSRSKVNVTLRKGVRRMIFRGTTQPVAANGVVRLQRRNDRGRWVTVKRGKLKPGTAPDHSRYRLTVSKRQGAYRVSVYPRDGGAHESGRSRVRTVK